MVLYIKILIFLFIVLRNWYFCNFFFFLGMKGCEYLFIVEFSEVNKFLCYINIVFWFIKEVEICEMWDCLVVIY